MLEMCTSITGSRTSWMRWRNWARSARTRGGRDPCLGQQIGAQQLRQGRRIHLVVLQPRRSDGLAPQRVHQVGLEPVVPRQPGQPLLAERCLERHRRAWRQPAEQPQHRLRAVDHIAVQMHPPVFAGNPAVNWWRTTSAMSASVQHWSSPRSASSRATAPL
jgi:hypothetical protein